MSKKFKIAVANSVLVPVEGTFRDAEGNKQPFKFSLVCERQGAEEQAKALDGGVMMKDFMTPRTTGWRDQTLVLEEDGTPAEFCPEALAALFDIGGVAALAFHAYLAESNAAAKN